MISRTSPWQPSSPGNPVVHYHQFQVLVHTVWEMSLMAESKKNDAVHTFDDLQP